MILRINWRNHSVDSEKIAHLIATNSATCPERLARQFVSEYLVSPNGERYVVQIPRRRKVWIDFAIVNFCGFAIDNRPSTDWPNGGALWFTSEGVRCAVENSLFRDLSFVEELSRRHGLAPKRILRRDVRPLVRPAAVALRRLIEADFVPGCKCESCRMAVAR